MNAEKTMKHNNLLSSTNRDSKRYKHLEGYSAEQKKMIMLMAEIFVNSILKKDLHPEQNIP